MHYGPDERWADWEAWYDTAYHDMINLTLYRYMWRNLIAMLQSNPDVEHHSLVNSYLTNTYAQAQAVGVRRQWDRQQRRPTIARLLYDIERFPEVASRARYIGLLDSPRENHAGWLTFSASNAAHIDTQAVAADLKRIDDDTADARDYVNKLVAHIDRDRATGPIAVGSGDWFGDINKGIDVLADAIKKYWSLFHPGQMLATMNPAPSLQWTRMFRTAWYSEDYTPVENYRFSDFEK